MSDPNDWNQVVETPESTRPVYDMPRTMAASKAPRMLPRPPMSDPPPTTAGIVFIFVSTVRVGPFRTALIMNLEPLIAMVGSGLVLDDTITPLQGLGSAIMLAA